MKRTFIFFTVIITAAFFASCKTANVNTNSANQNQTNHAGTSHSEMNHDSTNANSSNASAANSAQMNHGAMNQETMNHDAMNHSDMKSSPNAANAPYDLQFLDTMIAHHQGAVDMAKMIDGKTDTAELKNFGASVVRDQEKEIAQMKEWREKWFAGAPAAMNMEMAGMTDSMKGMDMTKLGAARGKDFDAMFVDMMIPHHEGAVVMSKDALRSAKHAEIKTLAQSIVMAQEAEINEMKIWKEKWSK